MLVIDIIIFIVFLLGVWKIVDLGIMLYKSYKNNTTEQIDNTIIEKTTEKQTPPKSPSKNQIEIDNADLI